MNLRTLMFFGFGGLIAFPALAQTPATTPAASATTLMSLDGLLALGFEVKAVIELSDAAVKALVPGQPVASQVLVTLQKGNSVATCEVYTVNWIQLPDASMSSPTLCSKR